MKKIVLVSLLILGFSGQIFSYWSKFLTGSTNSIEYRLLQNPDSFTLLESALIVAGVSESNIPLYLSQIKEFEASIRPAVEKRKNEDLTAAAKIIFDEMHKRFLKRYDSNVTTLDVILKDGRYNCQSSSVLYGGLLEDFSIEYKGALLPTHMYITMHIGDRDVDVENTSPYGFDIGTNQSAQDSFRKMTGFDYSHDNTRLELVDKKGIIASMYDNIVFFAHLANQPESAFQNAIRALAVYDQGKYVYTNIVAAYTSYMFYLTDNKNDYPKALAVGEEGIQRLPQKDVFVNNYFVILQKYLGSLVDASLYDEAFAAYENAKSVAGENKNLEEELYSRILFRMIKQERNFPKAYDFIIQAQKAIPDSRNLNALMVDGIFLISKDLMDDWKNYPAGLDSMMKWYKLAPQNNDFKIVLENYYSSVGIANAKAGNPDRGLEIIRDGLKIIPDSRILAKNYVFVAGSTANAYIKGNDLQNALKYIKIGLEMDPGNRNFLQNMLSIYHEMASAAFDKEDYSKAQAIVNDGLKYFPTDSKLMYYRDYLRKKGPAETGK